MASSSILRQCFSLLAYLTMIQLSLSSSNSAEIVSLDLYYESLCPYSADFIVNKLPIIFSNDIIDIVDLRLFPWGNAKLASNNSFTCQHGVAECFLNTVEACAIHVWPKLDDHFKFIKCVEKKAYHGKYTEWGTCFDETGLNDKPLSDCLENGTGTKLELRYAALTSALKPPHKYVPWVVVDGKPLYEEYDDFVSFVCKAYKGPSPGVCKKKSFASVLRKKTDQVERVWYKEHNAKMLFPVKIWSFITSWMDHII